MTHVETGTILDEILARTTTDLAERKITDASLGSRSRGALASGAAQSASRTRGSGNVASSPRSSVPRPRAGRFQSPSNRRV